MNNEVNTMNNEVNTNLYNFLQKAASWSSFAESLVRHIKVKGHLTEKQLAAAKKMMEKCKAREETKMQTPKEKIKLTEIKALFEYATEQGLTRKALRGNGIKLTEAGARSKNPGAIYVKGTDGQYYGKITVDGEWWPVSAAPEGIIEELKKLASDPLEYMKVYGQRTGECACCGRELTRKDSIELGIGPICAERWGII